MAIEYARSEMISRGKGGNVVRSAAYAIREPLYDERTGVTYQFKDDGTLQHAGIVLPGGVDQKYREAGTLFNAVEAAEVRKDAQVGKVVVVALDNSISRAERIEMAEGFARKIFVDRGYPALVAVHAPHDGGNHHAHLIGGTRQLGADGFAARKARISFTRAFGRPIRDQAERVGELWRDFQNAWFAAKGKAITVDPVGAVPEEHLGPKRFQHPKDPRIAQNEQIRESNHNLRRNALEIASREARNKYGLPLTVEEVARRLSPEYAKRADEAEKLRTNFKADWVLNRQNAEKDKADFRVRQRWDEMSTARRTAHLVGSLVPRLSALRDIELERWSNESGRGEHVIKKWEIRQATDAGKLDVANRLAREAFEKILPQAKAELERRQKIALNARYLLDNMARQDKLVARQQRSRAYTATL